MGSCTQSSFMNIINIGNSIIGVSILAMPYCFHKCGILLSLILIVISGLLTRLACYLLLKSAIMARRRNFECLAFHMFGSTGKLAVEMSVIGFLIGVCIAFFVVIGDLGPPLAAEFLDIENKPNLRTNLLMLVGLCVALPLGMLRKIDSLTSLSAMSIAFYGFLVLKIFMEAVPNLVNNEWWMKVNWWQSEGILPCLPIFSMALSCQTQLFEFFDTQNDPSLKRMQSVVSGAVHLCSSVYILVGAFGYIAFHDKLITGNALVLLTPSLLTEIIKLGFILTIAVSFPLCLFPCRSSLHSLLFKQGFGHHDIIVNGIPDHRFRILTVSLVIITIGIAIMLPNIEFVLGIIGSTIGTLICLIFPAVIFIHDTSKNTTEKRLAQVLMCIGVFILVACTYSTLLENHTHTDNKPLKLNPIGDLKLTPSPLLIKSPQVPLTSGNTDIIVPPVKEIMPKEKESDKEQKRLEPPIPQEPELKNEQNADLDPQALQKEDKELSRDTAPSSIDTANKEDKQQQLLRKLEEQQKEQKIILEQQKKVLEELKLHKESHAEEKKVLQTTNPKIVSKHQSQKQDVVVENVPRNENFNKPIVKVEPINRQDIILPSKSENEGSKIKLNKNVSNVHQELMASPSPKRIIKPQLEILNTGEKQNAKMEAKKRNNTNLEIKHPNYKSSTITQQVPLKSSEQLNLKKEIRKTPADSNAHIAKREPLGNVKENLNYN